MMHGVATACEDCKGKLFHASLLGHRLVGRDISVVFLIATTATKIYTLSLHDALPICFGARGSWQEARLLGMTAVEIENVLRSEEHTSELQSHSDLVCRLLLEKKKHELETITIADNVVDLGPVAGTADGNGCYGGHVNG